MRRAGGTAELARVGGLATLLVLSGLLAAGPSVAQNPPAPAPSAPAKPPDPALEAARAAFDLLPEPERKGIQDALVWTGDQVGTVDGSFGRQTYEGLMAYQRRTKATPNGILDGKARAALLAEGRRLRDAVGFAPVDDPRTGVRLGIPAKILSKRDVNPAGGSRWQSADGKITVDTRAVPAAEATLQGLYERNLSIQSPGRQVTYKVIRPDFFVVSGETQGGRFYTRYAGGPEGLRGLSVGYDKSLGRETDRLVVAIANSFVAFPGAAAPAVAASPQPQPAEPAAPKPAAPALLGSGIVVAPRRVVTAAPLESCAGVRVGDRKPVEIRPAGDGLSEIQLDDLPATPPLRLRAGPAEGDLPVLVLSYAMAGETPQLLAAPGTLSDGTLSAPLQAGASGGAVLDRSGALAGIVAPTGTPRAAVAGVVPVGRYGTLPPAALTALRPAQPENASAAADASGSVGEWAAALRAAVVPVVCAP